MFAHSRVALNVPLLPSGILVFRVIRHAARAERNDFLLPILFDENRIPFLLGAVAAAESLETERHFSYHYHSNKKNGKMPLFERSRSSW